MGDGLGSRAEVTLVVTMVMSFEWAPAPPAHLSHPGALHIKKERALRPSPLRSRTQTLSASPEPAWRDYLLFASEFLPPFKVILIQGSLFPLFTYSHVSSLRTY